MSREPRGAGRPASPTILLIEHDAQAARAVLEALSASTDPDFTVQWVRHCVQGEECLRGEATGHLASIDAAVVNLDLPDSAGVATLERLLRVAPLLPILVVCDPANEETARLAVRQGAQDYLFNTHANNSLLPKTLGCMIERARIAAALCREAERTRTTLESIGDAVIGTDKAGNITYLNAVAERLTGWSRDEAVGLPLPQVFRVIDAATREVA
ncbi:MAG TPA: PAS domain-containing protein, partial [Steroidobacteraceae bacterium]|nr:PAS domain-containing protein [Steroidobacteraceae bacterium]